MGNMHSIFFNHNTQFKKVPFIWTVPERELFGEITDFDSKLTGHTEFSALAEKEAKIYQKLCELLKLFSALHPEIPVADAEPEIPKSLFRTEPVGEDLKPTQQKALKAASKKFLLMVKKWLIIKSATSDTYKAYNIPRRDYLLNFAYEYWLISFTPEFKLEKPFETSGVWVLNEIFGVKRKDGVNVGDKVGLDDLENCFVFPPNFQKEFYLEICKIWKTEEKLIKYCPIGIFPEVFPEIEINTEQRPVEATISRGNLTFSGTSRRGLNVGSNNAESIVRLFENDVDIVSSEPDLARTINRLMANVGINPSGSFGLPRRVETIIKCPSHVPEIIFQKGNDFIGSISARNRLRTNFFRQITRENHHFHSRAIVACCKKQLEKDHLRLIREKSAQKFPSIEMLSAFQKMLFLNVATACGKEKESVTDLFYYSMAVIPACNLVLRRAFTLLNAKCSKEEVLRILAASAVGKLLPLLLEVLQIMFGSVDFSVMQKIKTPKKLLNMTKSLFENMLRLVNLTMDANVESDQKSLDPTNYRIVETLHPTQFNVSYEVTVEIPGASHLAIYFYFNTCEMELKLITPTCELNCESLVSSNRNSVLLPGQKVTFQITALPEHNPENIIFNALNDFKAIVVGRSLNLNAETWPCDLLKSAAGTLGKLCRAMSSDIKPSARELSLKWTSFPFFTNAPVNATDVKKVHSFADKSPFLAELIEKTPNSDGNRFDETMFSKARKTAFDAIVDPILTKIGTLFAAVCLKQLNVIAEAKEFSKDCDLQNSPNTEIFISIYDGVKLLRQFAMSQKHRIQNETDKGGKRAMKEVCEKIMEKEYFLLTFSSNENGAFFAKKEAKESLIESVLTFLKDSVTMKDFHYVALINGFRARNRTDAITCMANTLKRISLKSNISVSSITTLLCNFIGHKHEHYFSQIQFSGKDAKLKMRSSFFEWFKVLSTLLCQRMKHLNSKPAVILKKQLLAILGISVNFDDIGLFLSTDLIETVYFLYKNEPNEECRKIGEMLYYYFWVFWSKIEFTMPESFGNFDDEKSLFIKNYIYCQTNFYLLVQKNMKNMIDEFKLLEIKAEQEMSKTVTIFIDKNGNPESYNDCFPYLTNQSQKNYFDLEEDIFKTLCIYSSVIFETPFLKRLSPEILFELSQVGTLRLKTLSLRIMRSFLTDKTISSLQKNKFYAEKIQSSPKLPQTSPISDFFSFVFYQIGSLLLADSEIRSESPVRKFVNIGSGAAGQILAMEYAVLVRVLAKRECFRSEIFEAIVSCLDALSDLVDFEKMAVKRGSEKSSRLVMAMAALVVVGGYSNIFRVGGKAVNSEKEGGAGGSWNEVGTVYGYDEAYGSCNVIFNVETHRNASVNISKLTPLEETPMPNIFDAHLPKLISALKRFICGFSQPETHKKRFICEIKPKKAHKEKKPGVFETAEWCCPMCTFINDPMVHFCEMCNGQKSQSESKAKRGPDIKKVPKGVREEAGFNKDEIRGNFLFTQLKACAIKTFCEMVCSGLKENRVGLFEPSFKLLMKTAVMATNLKEFFSMETLETVQTKILEKIYEKANNLPVNEKVKPKKSSLIDTLPHSPFKYLQASLPTHFDPQNSKNCIFDPEKSVRRFVSSDQTSPTSTCFSCANRAAPRLIKAFYFEIKLLKLPFASFNPSPFFDPSKFDFLVAVGFQRDGVPLEDKPRNSSCYTATAKKPRESGKDAVGPFWGENDVIGCGYDSVKKTVWFTRNGVRAENAVWRNVSGAFFPAVWVEAEGVSVEVNFGHERFLYDFEGTLSKEYNSQLKKASSSPIMTKKERSRREKAESLVEIMGHFPIELCITALEQENDNLQSAADWLLEKGWGELEKMGDALLASSKSQDACAEDGGRGSGTSGGSEGGGSEEDDAEWESQRGANLPFGTIEDASRSYSERSPEERSQLRQISLVRYRAEISRGRSRRARNDSRQPEHDFALEVGHRVRIAGYAPNVLPGVFAGSAKTVLGQTGVVVAIDEIRHNVLLETFDCFRGSRLFLKVPFFCLKLLQSNGKISISSVLEEVSIKGSKLKKEENGNKKEKSQTIAKSMEKYIKIANAASILRIRRTVLSILNHFPKNVPIDLSLFGGKMPFISYIKLISAEKLSFSEYEDQIHRKDRKTMDALKQRLVTLLEADVNLQRENPINSDAGGGTITKPLFNDCAKINAALQKLHSDAENVPMERLITEECVLHFVQAANSPPPGLLFRSPGSLPYRAHCQKSGRIHIAGAKAMVFDFHPSSRLSGDMLTSLRFYKDDKKTELIESLRGVDFEKFKHNPLTLPFNRCFYVFTSSADNNFFGYRFKVKPIDLRIDDLQAINCMNIELGCWLLDMLLSQGRAETEENNARQLFDAVSWYVLNAKIGAKCRGVQLLNRIMLSFKSLPVHKIPPFSDIEPLYCELTKILNRLFDENKTSFPSQLVQSFVEVVAIIDVVRLTTDPKTLPPPPKANPPPGATSEKSQKSAKDTKNAKNAKTPGTASPKTPNDLLSVGRTELRIDRAELRTRRAPQALDVAESIAKVAESFDFAMLVLPPKPRWKILFGVEIDAESVLELAYRVVRFVFERGVLVEREVDKREVSLKCEDDFSIFLDPKPLEKVKEISLLTLNFQTGNTLEHTLMEAKKVAYVSNHHFVISERVTLSPARPGFAVQCPFSGSGYAVDTFCVMFWVYIAEELKEDRMLLCKGLDMAKSSVFPKIILLKNHTLHIEADTYFNRLVFAVETSLPTATWTHVTLNCDSGKLGLLIDGRLAKETLSDRKFISNADPFFVGHPPYGAVQRAPLAPPTTEVRLADVRYYSDYIPNHLVLTHFAKTQLKTPTDPQFPLPATDPPKPPSLARLSERLRSRRKWTAEMDRQVIELALRSIEAPSKTQSAAQTAAISSATDITDRMDRTNETSQMNRMDRIEHSSDSSELSDSDLDSSAELETQSEPPAADDAAERAVRSLAALGDARWDEGSAEAEGAGFEGGGAGDEEYDESEELDEADEADEYRGPAASLAGAAAQCGEDLSRLDAQEVGGGGDGDGEERGVFLALADVPLAEIRERFILIRMFNGKIGSVLPFVDFSQVAHCWSLAYRISALRHVLFYSTKSRLFASLLNRTKAPSRPQIVVSRPKALKAKEKGDPDGRKSVFGQIFRQLHTAAPSMLRYNGRSWSLIYAGEGGQDAGGLFRDSLSAMCDDLASGNVPLLIRCPNGRTGSGDNQDLLVPAPRAADAHSLEMLSFVGKLMGVAIRSHSVLNLDLPAVVWKPLVSLPVTRADIEAIDSGLIDHLRSLENAERHATPDTFEAVFPLTFTAKRADGTVAELCPGGAARRVRFGDCAEYAAQLEAFKLREFDAQVDSIRKGLSTVVPVSVLSLFTPEELEFIVCGRRLIDIEFLKENTVHRAGTSPTDPHVVWLWEILNEFSQEDRQKFLRFVWGQSRLPLTSEDFREKFSISTERKMGDESLPTSHTCFFSLHLPLYTSKEIMKKKLGYAVRNCSEIDADFVPNSGEWEDG